MTLRNLISFLFVLIASTGIMLAQAAVASNSAPMIDDKAEAELVKLVNQTRVANGLPELTFDPRLRETARFHATFVQSAGQIGYEFPNEPKIHARMGMMNILEDQAAENVSIASDLNASHEHAMSSEATRNNILSTRYNGLGIGVVRAGDHIYVVEDFARVLSEQSVPEVEMAVVTALNESRRLHKAIPLTYVGMPTLRKTACDTASKNKVDPNSAPTVLNSNADIHGMNTGIDAREEMSTYIITFTTFHPNEPPSLVVKNGYEPRYSVVSVGACFQRTESYPQGTYWVTVLMYHKQNLR
jgi:hypothetical protein